jgi:cardiolipin synthase
MNHNRFIPVTENAVGSSYRAGNQLVVLQNGDEIFGAMLQAVRDAKTSIEFLTYVYWHSDIANAFANILCERARAGVKVRLLVDAVGGATMNSRTFWRLEQAGVKIAWFRPLRWPHLLRANNRTHRKILLVDGHIGFTGGVGIADEWTGSAQDQRHWRETHCRIEGPACADLFAGFAENWHEATRETLAPPVAPSPAGSLAIQTIVSTAGRRPTRMERLMQAAIAAAEHKLWITTAYFVPSDEYIEALIAAAQRGADVRVLTNGPLTNHKVTRWAGQSSYARLLEGGVKIYEYQPTVLHSKVISIDDSWATLGSANLDNRSLIHNDELNISFIDQPVIASLDHQFSQDIQYSHSVQAGDWQQRGWLDRFAVTSASVFRGQL